MAMAAVLALFSIVNLGFFVALVPDGQAYISLMVGIGCGLSAYSSWVDR